MPALELFAKRSRALLAGSLGIAVAATFAWLLYNRNRKSRPKAVVPTEPTQLLDKETEINSEMSVRRGGRRNYRAEKLQKEKKSNSQAELIEKKEEIVVQAQEEQVNSNSFAFSQPTGLDCSWSEEVEREQQKMTDNFSQCHIGEEQSSLEVEQVMKSHSATTGNHHHHVSPPLLNTKVHSQCRTVESPSVASDIHSEASADSGRGGSTGVASSMSPVDEMAEFELMPIYEFEIPQTLVGLIIGIKGKTIKDLCLRSECKMIIRKHHSEREGYQICTVEGKRENINRCLQMLRRKFPPSRFPELNLKPVLPPPIASPVSNMWEKTIQLSLPESVSCEVVLVSMQDPGHLFLQQPTHPSFPSLARLDQFMNLIYEQQGGVPQLPRPIDDAVLCAAPALGGWFRAITVAFYEDVDEVLIRFVDYGGYTRLPASDLRQIRSDFISLPFQAVECYLANVQPTDSDGWSAEACLLVEQLACGQVIEAEVAGSCPDDKITLVRLLCTDQNNQALDLARVLVEQGFANWSDGAVSPSISNESSTIPTMVQ